MCVINCGCSSLKQLVLGFPLQNPIKRTNIVKAGGDDHCARQNRAHYYARDVRCDVFTAVVMNIHTFWDANTLTTGKHLYPFIYGN